MLRKRLGTTNVVESSLSGVEARTARGTRWQSGGMALPWATAAALETERGFRKIIGHWDLCILKGVLDDCQVADVNVESVVDKECLAA